MNEIIQLSGKLSFKFEGETSIDSELLIKTLSNVVQAYKTCMSAEYGEDAKVNIEVCAFREGSFDVVLRSVVGMAPLAVQYAPQILETTKHFIEIIKLKHELKGAKPQSVDNENGKTRIVNSEGEISYHDCNVYNLYLNNPIIDSSLSAAFDHLSGRPRPSISFRTEDDNSATVVIPEGSYSEMKIPVVDELLPLDLQKMESYVKEDLLLKSPDFLGDSKWTFLYGGKTISASITDNYFKQRVRSGKVKLSAGVRIPVKMKIEVYLNNKLEVVKRNYIIEEILGDIIEPNDPDENQESLFE